VALAGCSIEKMALRKVADILSAEDSQVFTADEDPELVGQALPFALKLYESLLESVDDSPDLYLATGKAFTSYARAFVQLPAEMLPDEQFEEQLAEQQRAKKLYLRARGYILQGLDLRRPGLPETLLSGAEGWESRLAETTAADAPWLYWAGLSWMGAFSAEPFDLDMLVSVPRAAAMMGRVLDLDETYDSGGVHEFFVSYYGGLPAEMGGSQERARHHYQRALELSGGEKAGPHVALAMAVSVKNQDVEEFRRLLEAALAVDLDSRPEFRLQNTLSQRQAAWLLEHVENYFLL
jgi:predicted anti-sigma-YlaC factor YlaD